MSGATSYLGSRFFPTGKRPDGKPTKEEAACCLNRRDALGRLPIGFCSPECLRRPERAS